MNNKITFTTKIVTSITISAVVSAVVLYAFKFKWSLSSNPENWGLFGDFIGGIANPAIAGCALTWLIYSVSIQRQELAKTSQALTNTVQHHEDMKTIEDCRYVVEACTSDVKLLLDRDCAPILKDKPLKSLGIDIDGKISIVRLLKIVNDNAWLNEHKETLEQSLSRTLMLSSSKVKAAARAISTWKSVYENKHSHSVQHCCYELIEYAEALCEYGHLSQEYFEYIRDTAIVKKVHTHPQEGF